MLPLRSFRPFSRARWPTKTREGLEIASGVGPDLALSEHGPCFVGSTVTLDDVSLTMKSRTSVEQRSIGEALDSSRFGDRQHCLGSQTPPRVLVGNKVPRILRPQNTGEHWQSGDPQCTSPAVAWVRHRVWLHTRVPQRQRQRHRRLFWPVFQSLIRSTTAVA